jgi:pSer/pThr/pTyr-binding forkhead associated (FHA) protein
VLSSFTGAVLRATRGGEELGQFPVRVPGQLRIGRAAPADIVIDHPTVSRVHAILEVGDDRMEIIDADSLPGVYVNGRRTPREVVVVGDKIRLGAIELEVLAA